MKTIWYYSILAVFFAVQFLLTRKARRAVVACVPVTVVLALMLACFIAYAVSGWTNWGWLILMMLATGGLVAVALGAVLGLAAKRIKKYCSCK